MPFIVTFFDDNMPSPILMPCHIVFLLICFADVISCRRHFDAMSPDDATRRHLLLLHPDDFLLFLPLPTRPFFVA